MRKVILGLVMLIGIFAISSCDDWEDLPENERIIEALLHQDKTEVYLWYENGEFSRKETLDPNFRTVIVRVEELTDTLPGTNHYWSLGRQTYYDRDSCGNLVPYVTTPCPSENDSLKEIYGGYWVAYIDNIDDLRRDLKVEADSKVTYHGYEVLAVEDCYEYEEYARQFLPDGSVTIMANSEDDVEIIRKTLEELNCKCYLFTYPWDSWTVVAELPLGLKTPKAIEILASRLKNEAHSIYSNGAFTFDLL